MWTKFSNIGLYTLFLFEDRLWIKTSIGGARDMLNDGYGAASFFIRNYDKGKDYDADVYFLKNEDVSKLIIEAFQDGKWKNKPL